jgi:hypothetical protein
MFTVYETSPRYCPHTDAIIGVIYHHLATVATRAEARAVAERWAETADMEERGLCLRDATGASVPFVAFDDPAPAAAGDDLPF